MTDTLWRRVLRYLIIWAVLFALLCVISVIRYWDEIVGILAATFNSYVSALVYGAVVIGLMIWGIRLMLRAVR